MSAVAGGKASAGGITTKPRNHCIDCWHYDDE